MKNKAIIALLTAGLSVPPAAFAQEDFPPPPDFDAALPPPPPTTFESSGSAFPPPAGRPSAGGAAPAADNGIMNKNQKQKFARAGVEDITPENFPETIESFDFPNVELTDIIKTISELTGKNFIIDPGVRGKITIVAPSRITVAEAYKAFLSALAVNGFTVVPSGSFLKVKNSRNAQRDSIETYSGAYYPNDDQMITRIIHLKHINAEIVNRELRMLTSKDGEMNIYSPTNSIILADYGTNVDRVMKIINQLDVPGFEEQIEVVRVRYAKAKDMADLIDKIVNKGQKSNAAGPAGSFTSGVPRFSRGGTAGGTQGQSGNAFFMAIPDDRTNTIIVVGNKAGIVRVKKLMAQLDFHISPEDSGGVFVYYVKFGDAEKIAQVLQGVTKDAAPKPAAGGAAGGFPNFGFGGPAPTAASNSSGAEIFGGEVKVTADKNTNSLVIVASKTDYEQVLRLLSKIDIARDQVYVEAVIMEMSMGDANNWQVGYFKYSDNGGSTPIKGGFNGLTDLTTLLSPTGGSGAILPFGSGDPVTITDPSTKATTKIPSLLGFLTFLKRNTRANVLSTPQLVAMDNESAMLEVGERVATSVARSVSTTGQETFTPTLEDATIKLELKPFISKGADTVRLEIKQQVKQLTTLQGLPANIKDNVQPLATRQINTNIVVNNGDTAILGGLMKDRESETVSKVPLLGDLPIIGWLFKSREITRDKVNLVVFLTPKVIRTQSDNNAIIAKKLDERLDFIKGAGGRDPYGTKVDEIQQRMAGQPQTQSAPRVVPQSALPQLPPAPRAAPAPAPLVESLKPSAQPPPPPQMKAAAPGELQFDDNSGDDLEVNPQDGEAVDPALTE